MSSSSNKMPIFLKICIFLSSQRITHDLFYLSLKNLLSQASCIHCGLCYSEIIEATYLMSKCLKFQYVN
jgi:hypothetical protein